MSAPTLVQKLSNVKHMPVLMAATSATKDPADGFLVKDVIKMSYESPQTRIFLQQYLTNQLITSSNVYTKLKVLRLFVDLLDDGHIEFKQNLRKTPEPFNEAMKLRPHLYNDQKMMSECGRIRDMASKVLDLLYMDAPELRRHPTTSVTDHMSSSSPSSSSDYRDNGSTRITGFGSSDSGGSRSSTTTTTTDRLKSLFGSSNKPDALVYDPSYATMDPVPHNVSSSQSAFNVDIPTRTSQVGGATPPVGARHERGQAGGGWGGGDRKSITTTTTGQWSSSSRGVGGGGGVVTGEPSSTSYESSGIEQEQLLVDKILAPGGVRVAPPREDLNKFISRCKVLDCQSVVECLRLKLSAEETNTVLRALFIMESLLRSDVPDVVSHFDLALQDLTDLTSSTNSSIKAKANKILMLLASSQKPPATNNGSSKVAVAQQLTSSGDDDIGEEEDVDGPGDGDQSEETQGVASIFSGLSVSGEKSQRPKQQPKKKTTKRTTPTASKKATQSSASPALSDSKKAEQRSGFEDILGLGDFSSETSNPAPQQSQQQQQQAEDPSLLLAMQQGLAEVTQGELPPEDNSLLTFEEDVEFDPLKRSGSVHRSDSVGPTSSSAASMPSSSTGYATQPALLDQQQLPPTIAPMTTAEPLPSSSSSALTNTATSAPSNNSISSAGQFGGLSGISLDLSSSAKKPPQKRQESLGELYQMAQTTSGATATPKSVGMAYPAPGMVPMVSAAPPGVQVPLGLQGGVVYGGGVVPVMYAPQGAQGVMYHQPQFGGVSRPVQIASSFSSKEQSAAVDTGGFSFIGKSSKTSAFDFVQDEMKASNAKK